MKTRGLLRSLYAIGLLCVLSCAGSTDDSAADTWTPIDPARLGQPCTSSDECGGDLVCDTDAPGGYCFTTTCGELEDCGTAGVCLTNPGGKACYLACDPAAPACRAGYRCMTIGSAAACLPAVLGTNEACGKGAGLCGEGLTCVALGSEGGDRCRPLCTSDNPACGENETCTPLDQGTSACLAKGPLQAGATCAATGSPCGEGLVCLLDSATSQSGRCRKTCALGTAGDCNAAVEECFSIQGSTGACVPYGTADPGDACTNSLTIRCRPNLVCLFDTESDDRGTCVTPCPDLCSDLALVCGSGYACVPLDDALGVCLAVTGTTEPGSACATHADCGAGAGCFVDGLQGEVAGRCRTYCVPGCQPAPACADPDAQCVPLDDNPAVGVCLRPES